MSEVIEREIMLEVPPERVWRALTLAEEFGNWFGVAFEGAFAPGKVTRGALTISGYEGVAFWLRVEVMEPERRFEFVWPYDETVMPDDPDIAGKTTRVSLFLEAVGAGTRLILRESGFERLPKDRRVQAFRNNEEGWAVQMGNIAGYLR